MSDLSKLEQTIRNRWRDLNPFSSQEDSDYARYVSLARAIPLGHEEQVVTSTAAVLTNLPADVKRLIIYSIDADLTYTDMSGHTPSATHGMIIPKGTVYIYDSDVDANFKLWTSGSSNVRLAYYG